MKSHRLLCLLAALAAPRISADSWAADCANPWGGSEAEKKLFGLEGAYGTCRWPGHLDEGHPDVTAASFYICTHLRELGLGTGVLDCSEEARDLARPWAQDLGFLASKVKRKVPGAGGVTMVDAPGVKVRLNDGKVFFIRPYTDHWVHATQCVQCIRGWKEPTCKKAAVKNPVLKLAFAHGGGRCESLDNPAVGGVIGVTGAPAAGP
jgi:hypothetical protein